MTADRSWPARRLALLAGLFLFVALLAGCAGLTPGSDGDANQEPEIPTPFQALAPEATSTETALPPSPSPRPSASPTATPEPTATPAPTASPVPTVDGTPREGQALIDALRGGGYVLYFRHAATDFSQGDNRVGDEWWANCDPGQMRQLSAAGQAQARAIGEAIRALEVPIGEVWASPYCRTLETARLMDVGPVQPTDDLMNMSAADVVGGAEAVTASARQRLAASPAPGTNTVLVAHGNVIAAAANVTLAEGEAAVLAPGIGEAGFTLIARVPPEEWAALAEQYARDAGGGDDQAPPLAEPVIVEYPVPAGSRPHDVAPAVDGGVWYTAQGSGELGYLDPETGETRQVALGSGSSPHGVIVGPDGAPWITDSGLNAIVRVDPDSDEVQRFPLPKGSPRANLNTAAFDGDGVLWFTGQNGVYGRLDPATGEVQAWDAPRGRGPYGITATPDGEIYYASLAGSHIAHIDRETGEATVIEPPTAGQGARRAWSDSEGRLWVSEWNAGQLGMYDPAGDSWREWRLPGDRPQPYAVYVDDEDMVWLSDFGANALVRFDPDTEEFEQFVLPGSPAAVRQILGRPGEIWGAESGVNQLVVIRTR